MTFPRVTIDQATSLIIDHRGKTPKKLGADWTISGHRVISAQNIKGSRIDENDHHYVDSRTYAKWMKVPLAAGDTLLTSEAPLGEVAYLQYDVDWVLGQRLYALRTEPSLAVGRFLFYALQSPLVRNDLESRATGTTVFGISQVELRKVQIPCPPIVEQQRIAEVLGALDDKIESNQNLAEVIPSLIDAQIHHALSDGSGDSIPVSKLAKFVNGGAYTKEASGTGRMVIRIADLNTGPGASTIYNDIDVPDDRLAHFGDLLMSWSGSLGVYVWVREEAIVNQHIFKVIFTDFPAWLVHNRLNVALHNFRAIAADKATTMGHIQRKHLDETFVEVPNAKLEQLNHLCVPLWNRFISAQLESMRLAELRDALLPELMSGRMRVDEAGRLVSEALDEEVTDV